MPPVDFLQLIKNSHISSHTAEQYWMPDAFDARMEDIHTLKSGVKLYLNSSHWNYITVNLMYAIFLLYC